MLSSIHTCQTRKKLISHTVFLMNISGNHFCSEINDLYVVSPQLNVFDNVSMDDTFDEQLLPETNQNVINISADKEISTSATTQSEQIWYYGFHSDMLTKHCLLNFFDSMQCIRERTVF